MRTLTYGPGMRFAKAMIVFLLMPTFALSQEPIEVVALGDSLTQGYGLENGTGFVPQLQEWVSNQGVDVNIVNAGVSGDTSAGGLSRVDWSLSEGTDAMIVTLGGNDLLRGLPPEVTRQNLQGILEIAQERGVEVLLVGMQAPGNYGPEFKASFDAIYPELAETYSVGYAPSFFEGLQSEGQSLSEIAPFMQRDGIHPNAEGVRRIVEALGPRVLSLIEQ